MRSLVVSIFLFMSAVSAALGEGFVGTFSFFPLLICYLNNSTLESVIQRPASCLELRRHGGALIHRWMSLLVVCS
jgi:hypothetical protein